MNSYTINKAYTNFNDKITRTKKHLTEKKYDYKTVG